METLLAELDKFKQQLPYEEQLRLTDAALRKIPMVYPFNKIEYIISYLFAKQILTYEQYLDMRQGYVLRNKYLNLFGLAPRTFGETWGQRHLMDLFKEFKVPNKNIDANYEGEYDLLLDDIHVEVKASRVVRKVGGKTLAEKALGSGSKASFDMNYQQLKPGCCDVFVWIAVWKDKIDYWVLSSKEVQSHPQLSNQHRGSQQDINGKVVEGQIHINDRNYNDFERYRAQPSTICEKIREKAGKVSLHPTTHQSSTL